MSDPAFLRRLQNELIEKGLLIDAGWVGFRLAVGWEDAPKQQLEECRNAFFAGAQHLFAAIIGTLDDGDDATPADLRRLDLINSELQAFINAFSRKHGLPGAPPEEPRQ